MSLTISQAGYESLERKLNSLQHQLHDIRIHKNKIAVENGNVWHDNHDFEQSEIEERRLLREISDTQKTMNSVTIIHEKNSSFDVVNYGAIVELSLKEDKKDEEDIFSVLFSDSDEYSEYSKISANSPLGRTIFRQGVGFIGNYTVAGVNFTVKILKIEY